MHIIALLFIKFVILAGWNVRDIRYFVHQPGFPLVAFPPVDLKTKVAPKFFSCITMPFNSKPPMIHKAPLLLRLSM